MTEPTKTRATATNATTTTTTTPATKTATKEKTTTKEKQQKTTMTSATKTTTASKQHQRKQKQQQSKFIPMFNDLKEQEESELKNIRSLCNDLIKRPSSFNAKDLEEMVKEYEDLEKEIECKLFI